MLLASAHTILHPHDLSSGPLVSNKRTTDNKRFSFSPPRRAAHQEVVCLVIRTFAGKASNSKWLDDAVSRINSAISNARVFAIASTEPSAEEGLKRMRKIADLSSKVEDSCTKLIEALTGRADGSGEVAAFIDSALSIERLDKRTVQYSRDFSAIISDTLAALRLIRGRALAANEWDALAQHDRRRPNFFRDALQNELRKVWLWATDEQPHFSTPHQKNRRGYLAGLQKRPPDISTDKTGPFINFVMDVLSLLGEPPTTGRGIASRTNRLKTRTIKSKP
jgi:hypothetical protein